MTKPRDKGKGHLSFSGEELRRLLSHREVAVFQSYRRYRCPHCEKKNIIVTTRHGSMTRESNSVGLETSTIITVN